MVETFEKIKEMITTLAEYGDVEFGFTLNGHDYIVTQYDDTCAIQRCGYSAEMAAELGSDYVGSGEFPFSTLDELYAATTVDGICLKDCWDKIEGMTIEDNTLDEFPFIVEAYENSPQKQAGREMKNKRQGRT